MFSLGLRMPLRLYWLLLINFAVNIGAETVYSHGSQYGSEPGTLTEGAQTPLTSVSLLQAAPCSGVNEQEPCFEVPPSASDYLSFQAGSHKPTSFSGAVSQESGQDFMQLGDAYSSPVFASSLNPSPSIPGSNLVQNMQHVVPNENVKYDSSTPRVVSYGSVYRLLKPNSPYSNNRDVPFASFKPPISSSVPSMSDQNGYQAGFSHLNHDATQQGDTYNSAAHHSRNKPSLNGVISSGPMITFVMPSPSPEPLMAPTDETSEPTSLPHDKCQILRSLNKPATAPQIYLARKIPPSPEFITMTPFPHLETATSFNLSLNPYFMARRQSGSFHSMLEPLQPKYFPVRYAEIRNLMSDGQASKGFQSRHGSGSVLASDHVQVSDHAQMLASQRLESVHSRPYESKKLFDYLVSLPIPAEQFIHGKHNQLQTGQSESANLTNPIWGHYTPAPLPGSAGLPMLRSVSEPVSAVDQTSHQSGVLVKPFQQILSPPSPLNSPESHPVYPGSLYGSSQLDSEFTPRGSRPVLNF